MNQKPQPRRTAPGIAVRGLRLVLLLAAACVLFGVSSASASELHRFLYQVPATEVPGARYFSTGIAVDNSSGASAGDLYIGSNNPQLVDKFSPSSSTATYLCQITGAGSTTSTTVSPTECEPSTLGTPAGKFNSVFSVAVDPSDGSLYATENAFHLIDKFSSTGAFEKQLNLGSGNAPRIAAEPGALFIDREQLHKVEKWEPATETLTTFATEAGSPLAPLGLVSGVAVDLDPSSPNYKDVYVADNTVHAIDKYSSTGTFLCQITGRGEASTSTSECSKSQPGLAKGALGSLSGLAVDPSNGHLYVVDNGQTTHENQVDEFNRAGDYITSISEPTGRFWAPFNLALSAATGDLFVASINNPNEAYAFSPDSPLIVDDKASAVTPTSATLHGTVNPLGIAVTKCEFEYVEADQWEPRAAEPYAKGASTPCLTEADSTEIGSGEAPVAVHADLSGLQAGKVYHFRIAAENARAAGAGDDELVGVPFVLPKAPTEIEQSSVTLNASVNPDGVATSYQFEYGEPGGAADTYNHTAPATPAGVGSGSAEESVSQHLTGLQSGATYHYRISATNSAGAVHGPDRTFDPLPAALIDPIAAVHQTTSSAILQAYVDPLGAATSYRFEYGEANGPAGAYGHSTTAASAGSGSAATLVGTEITGLQPGSTYHFRTIATNANGTVTGPDVSLETEPASCPNDARREEQGKPALMLPDCRAFEQVSPEEKGGAPTMEPTMSASGERILYKGRGSFAGNTSALAPIAGAEYLAHRTPEGWVSEAIHPSPAETGVLFGGNLLTPSADLSESLWGEKAGVEEVRSSWFSEPDGSQYFRRTADGTFVPASPLLQPLDPAAEPWHSGNHEVVGESADLSHVLLMSGNRRLLSSDTLANSEGGSSQHLYDITTGPSPSLAYVPLDNSGHEIPSCPAGGPDFAGGTLEPNSSGASDDGLNVISADGSHIFFTLVPVGDCTAKAALPAQLYVRIDQSETVSISEPESNAECETSGCRTAPPQQAGFSGASEDGSKAFFLDTHRLVDQASEDPEEGDVAKSCSQDGPQHLKGSDGCNLYMYDFNRPSGHNLVALSAGDPTGTGPRVRGILRSSEDGSRVYFVAEGLLTDTPNSLGQRARAGAENLYLYDTAKETVSFVATLCTGEEASGTLGGVGQCSGDDESNLFNANNDHSFASHDGNVFIFTTYSRITPDDENESPDVYRYEASTGSLQRISIGHDGEADGNGNGGGSATIMFGRGSAFLAHAWAQPNSAVYSRPMSESGSQIVFVTARPLEKGDENGQVDAYEWHDGQVSLISGGKSTIDLPLLGFTIFIAEVNEPIISPSGEDISFLMDVGLVPGDTDGLTDVYDARVDGGFKPPPPPRPPCEGTETCHGQGTQPGPAPNITHLETEGNPLHCHKGFVERHGKCLKKHHVRHERNKGKKHKHRAKKHLWKGPVNP